MMDTPAETLDADATHEPSSGSYASRRAGSGHAPPDALVKGDEMGRYVVLRRLGMGGMGTVYLAFDPELDRKVALKLLRGPARESNARALLREAQAMARLRHPNVVAVHDVGEHRGRVYVAMDFVEGRTLTSWLRAERRGWREVLEVFSSAGQGLVAAHERGLIHRDFKPDNVMVSDERHVLVMDFGLARPSRDAAEEPEDLEISGLRGPALNAATAGHLAGTPAYMAPEQVMAGALGPAVDQFAFCVSLWEAVCGQRPFAGTVSAELFANASMGRVRPPPAGMPRWLERVLRRGLAPSPPQRWSSMTTLLAALDRGRRRWRWQAAMAGGLALLVVAGALWGARRQRARARQQAIAACEAQGMAIDEVWNERRRAQLRAGLLATGAAFAPASLETLLPWLDDYREAWSAGRTEACRHDAVERDWDESLYDRAQWCFEDRRLQLEATVEQITTLNAASARRAVRLASYLDPVDRCLDPALLLRLPAPPAEMRDEIRAIRAELTDSDRHRHGGRYAEALAVAQRARQRAEALGWSPLLALARFIEGRCLFQVGQFTRADATLTTAYFEAQDAGSAEVAFRAARSLMVTTSAIERYREAEVWSRHARVLSSGLEDPSGLDAAEGHYLLIGVYMGLGDYEAAAREGSQALAMRTEALGAEHPITASAMRNLGRVYLEQARPREALELFERSLGVWEEAVGHEHPYIGELLVLRGDALRALGHLDEALAVYREGLAVLEPIMDAEHPNLAKTLDGLGQVLLEQARLDEAERVIGRAVDIRRAGHRSRHPLHAYGLLRMAAVDRRRGRYEDARRRCAQALGIARELVQPDPLIVAAALEREAEIDRDTGRRDDAVTRRLEALGHRRATLGPRPRRLMLPLVELGDSLRTVGRRDDARQSYAEALAIGERVEDAAYAVVPSLTGLAELAVAEGEHAAALRLARRAVRVAEREGVGPRMAAGAHLALARALRARGDHGGQARASAEQARDEYATFYDGEGVAAVERLLAD